MFDQYEELPEGFLDATVENLHEVLPKPSLIHLKGETDHPIFICTLLHGNETTGFYALQKLLHTYPTKKLPRSISIFIGNVKAAEKGVRRLEQQVDYNRVWPGTVHHYLAEAHMMQQITDIMRDRNVWASIDIHNNTGKNPHYACINKLETEFTTLAYMFSETLVYFTTPKGVQSSAFAELCPSVTLECGLSGQAIGVDHALNYLHRVMLATELDQHHFDSVNLYHTVARVNVPELYSFGFEDDATINLLPELARVEPESSAYLQAFDDDDREVGRDFFEYHEDKIVLKKPIMPAMLTMDTQVIRQDCLCYLMEKVPKSILEE